MTTGPDTEKTEPNLLSRSSSAGAVCQPRCSEGYSIVHTERMRLERSQRVVEEKR